MSEDADHEVIDSPQALFRHLYEAHHVQEARDLDPYTAPVQFWVRRHAELERAARLAARDPRPSSPGQRPADPRSPRQATQGPRPTDARDPRARGPGAGGGPGRFEDPLVEALVLALVGRGHEERRVRGFVRSYVSPDGARSGAAGVRAWFVNPILDAIADRMAAGPGRRESAQPGPPAPARPAAPTGSAPRSDRRAPAQDDVMAIADLLQDRRGGAQRRDSRPGRAPRPDDDVMAIADVVQRRRSGHGSA